VIKWIKNENIHQKSVVLATLVAGLTFDTGVLRLGGLTSPKYAEWEL